MNENTNNPGLKTAQNSNPSQGMSGLRIIGLILLIGGCLALAYLLYQYRFLVFDAAPSGRPNAEYYEQMYLKEYVNSNPGAAFSLYCFSCGFGYAGIAAVLGLILTIVGKKR